MKKILVTGGVGYIGSHTVVELIEQGFETVIFDNLSNSSELALSRIEQITGVRPALVRGDIREKEKLDELFDKIKFDAVIHFAGLKAVGQSVEQPLKYYRNNVEGSLVLFRAMSEHQCFRIVFSSSATVYGDPHRVPITEDFPLSATNPYGQSKLMIENILRDLAHADRRWQTSILRYFNPVAAHPSGLIGEDPKGIPNNLLPYIAQVAVGKLDQLAVFGADYDTPDGTGVRDYIHVVDLARAHLKSLQYLSPEHGCQSFNIGTGKGYSVLEMVAAFERASGSTINYRIEPRRAGDIAECFADVSRAERRLGWKSRYAVDRMMQDQWRWQSENPSGYQV
ncbi:MAG: UDP-glucose 4-epimerase GalE [Gammaproteobacteria bacterium]|nr:UDP-glucose 4-epimerase GalE [Gammaproteobacteria bacterium]